MSGQQNCQPQQLHGGFLAEREICTVELHTIEVLRRVFGSQIFLRNCASPELPTLTITRCHFGLDTQNWIPRKFYGQLSAVVAKLRTWAVLRRLFGPEETIKILGREITSQLAGRWAGGDWHGSYYTTHTKQLHKLKHFMLNSKICKIFKSCLYMHTIQKDVKSIVNKPMLLFATT